MIIAWTYLLHAYFRGQKVDYRYYKEKGKRKVYERIEGRFRNWELKACLQHTTCPLDRNTSNNLLFLIGLRNEIEHARASQLDSFLSGRYQACALNFNHYLVDLFGEEYRLDTQLAYSIQFSELSFQQAEALAQAEEGIPRAVRSYIATFDDALNEEEFNSDRYSYRVLFSKKLTGKRGQADRTIEFVAADSDLAETINHEYWVQKEVEKPKFRPTEIINKVREAGFPSFGMHQHTELWKSFNAKDPSKGYGVEVSGSWYWYDRWMEFVVECLMSSAPETKVSA
jgi:hypothetical protein